MTPPFDFLGAVRTLREAAAYWNTTIVAKYPPGTPVERIRMHIDGAKEKLDAAESSLLTAVRALEVERDALDAYATREHQHRVEAELENQGLHGTLDELAVMADALHDPMANAYDGATTRAVIVRKLQGYHANRALSQEDRNGQ